MFRVARGERVKLSTNSPSWPPLDRWAIWSGYCSLCCFWDTLVVCCKLVDLIYKVFQITGAGYYMVHNYFTVWLGGDVSHSMKATITLILNIRPDTFTGYVQTYDLVWRHISAVIISETMHHCTKIKVQWYNIFQNTRRRWIVPHCLSSVLFLFLNSSIQMWYSQQPPTLIIEWSTLTSAEWTWPTAPWSRLSSGSSEPLTLRPGPWSSEWRSTRWAAVRHQCPNVLRGHLSSTSM